MYQHPRGDADNSDFIGTPQHDFRRNPTCMVKNILLTRGTLHGVNMSVLNHAAQQWATWFKSTESGQFPANTDIVESLVPLNDLEVEEHLSGGRGGVGVLLGGRCSGFHFPCGKAASLCGFLTGFVQGDALDGQQGNVHLVVAFCIHGSVHCSALGSGSSSKDFPQDIFFLFWYISQTRREQRQAMKTLIGLPASIPAASRCPVRHRGFEPDRRRFFSLVFLVFPFSGVAAESKPKSRSSPSRTRQ